MFQQQAREILQAEANEARARDEAAAAERSRQEAEEMRRRHEEQRRREAEQQQEALRQQVAADTAALQAFRTTRWFNMNPTR